MGLDRMLNPLECIGEGVVMIPFGFTINGTTHPDALKGSHLASVSRSEAGEFLCTLAGGQKPYSCIFGYAGVSATADDVDMMGTVDWSTVASDGTFVVRTMTGATQTDPTDNLLVGGFLLVNKSDRTGGAA
jgi:hypothetical protein